MIPIRSLLVAACLVFAGAVAAAGDVKRELGAYVVYLPAETNFDQVVERVQDEILAQNWEVLKVQDIDKGLKEHHNIDVQNKLILACKSQYLAQAIQFDPDVSMIIPCRIAVYRVGSAGQAVSGDPELCAGGKIIVGFSDPVEEAKRIGIGDSEAVKVASKELQAILQGVADHFKK
ncbi:MAG: DUF302 domain-containing protein [Pseudomonadota bacterium]